MIFLLNTIELPISKTITTGSEMFLEIVEDLLSEDFGNNYTNDMCIVKEEEIITLEPDKRSAIIIDAGNEYKIRSNATLVCLYG